VQRLFALERLRVCYGGRRGQGELALAVVAKPFDMERLGDIVRALIGTTTPNRADAHP
jgi:hypothetical protein